MNKPHKIYAENLDKETLDQFNEAMKQPFVVKGALMPDAHLGYSLPIGGVVACKDIVVPSYVGYDIGCGMCALKLGGIKAQDIKDNAEAIHAEILKRIPVGTNKHIIPFLSIGNIGEYAHVLTPEAYEIFLKRYGPEQMGTLGGGNHFIEIGSDKWGDVWVIIHSGSRGMGHGIASHYIKKADPDGKCRDGHHGFYIDSKDGQNYLNDLEICQEYALNNRELMIIFIIEIIEKLIGPVEGGPFEETLINRNHNHAELKDGLIIHRKGATHAEKGMMGVIPGNMKDGSFIVKGKGNPESLCSSSHGAGRVLGRREAKRKLCSKDFKDDMKGIVAQVGKSTIDESPRAYKDIFDVMKQQEDLVEIVAYVKPILNVKG